MNQSFVSAIQAPPDFAGPAYWFIFSRYRLLVLDSEGRGAVPFIEDPAVFGLKLVRRQYLGYCTDPAAGYHAFAAEVDDAEPVPPGGMALLGLRRLFGRMDENMVWLAGRAVQLVEWHRATRFCGHCGVLTVHETHERAKKCPDCGRSFYPRLSPAIIVAVVRRNTDGAGELLLARSRRHPPGFYSVLAGFVEPGETLETAVAREVKEEVNLDVSNIRYFGSQPWPFPDSLMLAFTADYAGGEIVLEEEEMAEAAWYTAASLPPGPPSISIARQLIDWFSRTYGTRGENTAES